MSQNSIIFRVFAEKPHKLGKYCTFLPTSRPGVVPGSFFMPILLFSEKKKRYIHIAFL
jgi:hypothetical protein